MEMAGERNQRVGQENVALESLSSRACCCGRTCTMEQREGPKMVSPIKIEKEKAAAVGNLVLGSRKTFRNQFDSGAAFRQSFVDATFVVAAYVAHDAISNRAMHFNVLVGLRNRCILVLTRRSGGSLNVSIDRITEKHD